jgi:uncharacterized membrane protein
METKPQTSREYFRTMMIIFIALVTGQVMFGLVALFLQQIGELSPELQDMKMLFLIMVCGFVAGGYLGSRFLFRNSMKTAKEKTSLAEMMAHYRSALIVRYALLEGPSMFAVIAFLITGDYIFLGVAGFIIVIFITMPPTKSNAIRDLELNPDEERKINDPEQVIY